MRALCRYVALPVLLSNVLAIVNAQDSLSLDLPVGRVEIEFTFPSAFPDIDSGDWWADKTKANRLDAAEDIYPSTSSDLPWHLQDIAAERGLFHVVTILIAAMERFFNHDYNNGMPQQLLLPKSLQDPITIAVYESQEVMAKDAAGWVGHEGKNGYFDPKRRKIGVVIDPGWLPEMFPPDGSPTTKERAGQAIDAVRRTILIPFIHELVHALQQDSRNVLFKSPFFAEGQATFLAQRAERAEVLFPVMALQLVASLKAAGSDTKRHETIFSELKQTRASIMKGNVKLIEEYMRLVDAKNLFRDADGQTLGRTICLSRRRFGIGPDSGLDYDIAWLFYQFVCADNTSEESEWFKDVLAIAKSLEVQENANVTASIERKLIEYINKECPLDSERVVKQLGNAVGLGDRMGVEGRHFDRYRLLIDLARHDPRSLLLLPYFGDFFLTVGQRDRFFFYYRDALQREANGNEATLSGRIRVVSHYVESLVKIGHLEAAARIITKHSINPLDIQPLQALCLRKKWFIQCQESNWGKNVVEKLTKEYELGFLLIGLQQMSTGETIMKASSERPEGEDQAELQSVLVKQFEFLKARVRNSMKQLGYEKIPRDAWFLLDFQIIERPIDTEVLLESTLETSK